jgi:hypothetical protein
MDELRVPDRRSLPNRPATRRALQAEVQRLRGPRRLAPTVAKWSVGAAAAGLAVTVGVLTIVGQGGDSGHVTAPAAGQIEPGPDQALHLVTTVEKEGQVIEKAESWSVVGPPRRERVVVDHLDPLNPPNEYEVVGAYITWRYDAGDGVIRRLTSTEGPIQISGSSANWRRLNGIPGGRGVRDGGEVTVDRIRAHRYVSPPQRGLRHAVLVDPLGRLVVEEIGSPAVGGGQPTVRITMRAEYIPAAAATLNLRSVHPGAHVVTTPVTPGGDRAAEILKDFETDPGLSASAEVARSMPRGSTLFIGTDPTCAVVRQGIEYTCTLRSLPDPPMLTDYTGSVFGIVDSELRVSGGCRGLDSTGATWRCLLGEAAVGERLIDATLLGHRQLGPASG